MSLRLRLTLLYSVILALTLVAFSVTLYITSARITYRAQADALRHEAQQVTKALQSRLGDLRFGLNDIDWPIKTFSAAQTFVQTCDSRGAPIARTANLQAYNLTLPLSDAGLQAVQQGRTWYEPVVMADGRLLVYSQPVKSQGQVIGIVQVARSLYEQDRSLSNLRRNLTVGSMIVTVVAFGVGWMLSGTALRPISRITDTAQAIGADRNFARRVDYTGPQDEVGHLATTFNTMLTELQAAYQQVEDTVNVQRRFIADASHELRTPLTTLRGNISLLQRTPPISDPDRVAVLTDMVDESERMSRLVNDLLALARADAGRILRREPVSVRPLIEDVCRKAQMLAPDRKLQYTQLHDVAALGDPDALTQVLLILLDNALKFTPARGTITVTTAITETRVAISIQDTGLGIPPDVLPRIWDRFYCGDPARTGEGAGLGLSIAKTLVEAQHGTITAVSTVGQGSIFTVTLLRADAC
jgi:two-component system OmpR family sensor kinase